MFREPWRNTIGHEQKPDICYGVVLYYVAVFIYECSMTPNKYFQCASSQKQKALQYSLHILYCIRSEHNMQSFRSEFLVAFGCMCIATQLTCKQQNHRSDISSRERRTQSVFELLADRISYIIRQHLFHINITRFRNAIR